MSRFAFLKWGERLIEKGAWYLAPLSLVYALIVTLRNFLYDVGFLRSMRVKPVVVSVGNVVVGGSGKTPFVEAFARAFPNRKIAILSRGYGALPDEPMWLSKKLPEVQVLVGRDRAKLASLVEADLILLDDGMQHRRLFRDFDIRLGETKGHYLPWGFLRDNPRRKVDASFEVILEVDKVVDPNGNEISLKDKEVGIFCGIAKPSRFKKSVESTGARIVKSIFFADHEPADWSRLSKDLLWVCTEKDAIKMQKIPENVCVLEMRMRPVAWEKLIAKINEEIDNRRL